MSNFPKILVATPTSKIKDYCFDEWIESVMNFTYPNYDIVVFDNTNDGGKYAEELNQRVKQKYGENGKIFNCYNSLVIHNAEIKSIHMKICLSHNDCRSYCIENNYEYMFHLESDIFPPKDVIERLMFHKKHCVGGTYHIYDGLSRTLLLYNFLELAFNSITSKVCTVDDEIQLVNGDLIKIAQCGLGCILLSNKLVKKISFRYEHFKEGFPDTFFAEDCLSNNIPIFCDTSIICRHENKFWGVMGLDY